MRENRLRRLERGRKMEGVLGVERMGMGRIKQGKMGRVEH